MKQFNIFGMSCAACQARVEKAVSKVEGVKSVSVSLLTNTMGVEGNASDTAIIKAVRDAGYNAEIKNTTIIQNETKSILKRLIYSAVLTLALMLVPMNLGWVQMSLALAVILINNKFFISGVKSVIHGAPNMDTLVSLGSSVSFIWSIYSLLAHKTDLYFESAAMILTLITVGKLLESISKGKTTNALKALISLKPKTATVIRNNKEISIDAEQLQINDIFVVKPGESFPADGIIVEGHTAVDESSLSGESIPIDKSLNSEVFAATVNLSGYVKCKATKVGKDTTLSQIIKMVEDAAATKAPIAKVADKVSGVFVPSVISIALITMIIWLITGKPIEFALTRAISVLVISCPCALGLATPVAIMVGNGVGAKNGLLFKTSESLEQTGKAKIVVLDKTGTITNGQPVVVKVSSKNEAKLLEVAYTLESKSEHPLAKAVLNYANKNKVIKLTDFEELPGNGLVGKTEQSVLRAGSPKFIEQFVKIDNATKNLIENESNNGLTPLLFSENNSLLGIIFVADTVKTDAKKAVSELNNMGLQVVMLTGDNKNTANAIAKQVGIDYVYANLLPNQKALIVKQLSKIGKVIMVGDGINDAPALSSADIGFAIGAGTDVAIDSADVVLVNSNLDDVVKAIRLSRATLMKIYENLFWAFFYNIICIPLAATSNMKPMFGAAAMSLSSFCVVTNALRLNLLKINSSKHDRTRKKVIIQNIEEVFTMTKTMTIEGMMCPHCEARVKKVLESIDGVQSADVSHEKKSAILTLTKDVDNILLKEKVEEQEYKVIEIR